MTVIVTPGQTSGWYLADFLFYDLMHLLLTGVGSTWEGFRTESGLSWRPRQLPPSVWNGWGVPMKVTEVKGITVISAFWFSWKVFKYLVLYLRDKSVNLTLSGKWDVVWRKSGQATCLKCWTPSKPVISTRRPTLRSCRMFIKDRDPQSIVQSP